MKPFTSILLLWYVPILLSWYIAYVLSFRAWHSTQSIGKGKTEKSTKNRGYPCQPALPRDTLRSVTFTWNVLWMKNTILD